MSLSADNVSVLNRMCPGAERAGLGTAIAALQAYPEVFTDIPITTSGAVNTLTGTNNVGLNACIQANVGAAAAGGSIYTFSFGQTYSALVDANLVSVGQVPAVSALQVLSDGSAGGVATVTFVSASDADYITFVIPGITSPVVLTAKTSPTTDSQFTLGNGGTDSATALAVIINATIGTGANKCAALIAAGNPLVAYAVGAGCVIRSKLLGATIKSHNQTKECVVSGVINTVDVASVMQPGVVVQFAVGVTATVPASGDELKVHFQFQN